jgi:hypothetical protein
MKRIYIASPYSRGDVAANVKRQIDVADILIASGYAPFVPLLSHFQHMIHPRPEEDWKRLDMEWLRGCSAVLRLYGHSPGADAEVIEAERLGIPVYYSLDELLKGEAE